MPNPVLSEDIDIPSPDQTLAWLEAVSDPEIPVISVVDLGVVRRVECRDGCVTIVITPTYSGCPAMAAIARDIENELLKYNLTKINIITQISPTWTTDWLSSRGKTKLE